VGILTDHKPKQALVDRGSLEGIKVCMSGMKRGLTRALKPRLKRRGAIEPVIGHMKNDGLPRCN
jgi:IS5 family transposase